MMALQISRLSWNCYRPTQIRWRKEWCRHSSCYIKYCWQVPRACRRLWRKRTGTRGISLCFDVEKQGHQSKATRAWRYKGSSSVWLGSTQPFATTSPKLRCLACGGCRLDFASGDMRARSTEALTTSASLRWRKWCHGTHASSILMAAVPNLVTHQGRHGPTHQWTMAKGLRKLVMAATACNK